VKNGGTATAFTHDAAGNLTTERTATTSRIHTYDAANHLTRILPAAGDDADLTYDPLGRIATRQVGTNPVQTLRYVGASDLVWQQASSGTTTSSIVDPSGARVGSTDGTASGGAWLLFDLLGSVAGAESGASGATSAVTTALRYDGFGQTIGTYPLTGSNLAVRYRGLIDLAPTADADVAGVGSDPLYAMGARLYARSRASTPRRRTALAQTYGSPGSWNDAPKPNRPRHGHGRVTQMRPAGGHQLNRKQSKLLDLLLDLDRERTLCLPEPRGLPRP
jgi:YD repeat-containing protein